MVDIDKLWEEIDSVIGPPLENRKEGDLDIKQLAEHHNCTERYAQDIMDAMVAAGGWEIKVVRGLDKSGRTCTRMKVLRKIEK